MDTKRLQIIGDFGHKLYSQPDEPVDAADGSLWVDTDEPALSLSNIVSAVLDELQVAEEASF